MKERPILFSGAMVRAILEGKKTQTRRVVKPQPKLFNGRAGTEDCGWPINEKGVLIECPYGTVGDRLWVRETWYEPLTNYNYTGDLKDHGSPSDPCYGYRADAKFLCGKEINDCGISWKPSIYMPRKACRITLEIEGIRVERLQDISEYSAKAEGVEPLFSEEQIRQTPDLASPKNGYKNYLWHGYFGSCGVGNSKSDAWYYQYSNYQKARDSFSSLWELINGAGSWESNPWVWVLEFKKL